MPVLGMQQLGAPTSNQASFGVENSLKLFFRFWTCWSILLNVCGTASLNEHQRACDGIVILRSFCSWGYASQPLPLRFNQSQPILATGSIPSCITFPLGGTPLPAR